VGAVGSIVKQLQTFASDFPDIVSNAIRHLAVGDQPKRKRGLKPGMKRGPNPKAARIKPTSATPAQVKAIIGALIMNKDGIPNHPLAKHTKLHPGVVSAALRQLRDEGKVKSFGKGRATTWTMTGK
jgi:ribosomal protein S25